MKGGSPGGEIGDSDGGCDNCGKDVVDEVNGIGIVASDDWGSGAGLGFEENG